MLQQLFRYLCARRPLALACMVAGTLLFVLASALKQAFEGNTLAIVFSLVLMVLGLGGQLLGLMAFMRGRRR